MHVNARRMYMLKISIQGFLKVKFTAEPMLRKLYLYLHFTKSLKRDNIDTFLLINAIRLEQNHHKAEKLSPCSEH